MNKKLFIGGCGLAAIAGNVFAADEEYSYFTPCVALKGGYAFLGKRDDIKYKGGFTGAVEMGVSYDAWRFGVEVGYRSNNIKNFKLANGFEGTNYILNGGIDVNAAGGGVNLAAHTMNGAPAMHAEVVAIGEKSIFNANATAGGINNVFGQTVANGEKALFLKNVTEFKFEKMSAMTGMVNVCYDYAMTDAWSLYAGVGLGVARVNLTVSNRSSGATTHAKIIKHEALGAGAAYYTVEAAKKEVLKALPTFFDGMNDVNWQKSEISKTVFAWQFMAGVGYELSENLKLTFGYKLFNTAKVKQNFAGKDYKIKTPFNHTAEFGAVLSF